MSSHIILEEAKNLVEQVEDLKIKLQLISKENVLMKGLVAEKNKKLLEMQEKTEELTRLLIMSDKMLSEMREKLYNKEEKTKRLSKKLNSVAETQDEFLLKVKNAVDSREAQIMKLSKEKEEVQKKLIALLSLYENTKGRLRTVSEKLDQTVRGIPKKDDREVNELKQRLQTKEEQIMKLTKIFSESQAKMKYFEEINMQLAVKYEQEKEVLGRLIKKREGEIEKLREFMEKANHQEKAEEKPVEIPKIKVTIPRTLDPFEQKELKSMINIAKSHGEPIEKIRESLLNAGYEKEKINQIIRRA